MKKSLVLIFFIISFSLSAQVQDNFSDGDFTNNPIWIGITENFKVNSSFELQSKASITSKSYLCTPSEAFDNATWEVKVKVNYTTSSSNYAAIYIISDRSDISGEMYGYYVKVGGTSDEISLFRKKGNSNKKIIDGMDKVIDTKPVEVIVRVTRDKDGTFRLYRKLPTDNDFIKEGEVVDNEVLGSKYFGLFFSNTSSTGDKYYFDDVLVTGDKLLDETSPIWTNLILEEPNKLILEFSEEMDFSEAAYQVNNGIGQPSSIDISADNLSVTLTFNNDFEKGIVYTVDALHLKDTSGNLLELTQKQIGIVDKVELGDIVINEILPNPEKDIPEYFEVYNTSDKILDLSEVYFATRKSDGTFSTSNSFPDKTLLLPKNYLAISSDYQSLKDFYKVPPEANIVNASKWSALNNSSANLLLTNDSGNVIYDEVKYDENWHTVMIRDPKGVSLEKINPDLPSNDPTSWHSASTDSNYGTPGYKNSQYRDLDQSNEEDKWAWVTPEAFTPDNDGIEDVIFIHYKTNAPGFTANVIIFNAVGVQVKKLASNNVLGEEGALIWDGNTDDGKLVNSGIYIAYFEMINVDTGVKKIEKIPFVVSLK